MGADGSLRHAAVNSWLFVLSFSIGCQLLIHGCACFRFLKARSPQCTADCAFVSESLKPCRSSFDNRLTAAIDNESMWFDGLSIAHAGCPLSNQ